MTTFTEVKRQGNLLRDHSNIRPYVDFDTNLNAWVASGDYALSLDSTFIDHITIDEGDSNRVWIMKLGKKSHARPISILSQVSVWKVELVA